MTDRHGYVMLLVDNLNNAKFTEIIGKQLKKHPVGLVYLDIKRFGEIEQRYGKKICSRILQVLKQLILEAEQDGRNGVFVHRMFGDDMFLFVQLDPDDRMQMITDFRELARQLRVALETKLNDFMETFEERIELYVGTALLDTSKSWNTDAILYNAIKQAIYEAKNEADEEYSVKRMEFLAILDKAELTAHYQPIVRLEDGEIYGYEALTRGPQGSYFASPLRLFDFAENEDSLYSLERISRERAIQSFSAVNPAQKLFINMNANVINDPQFTPGKTLQLLEQMNLTPQNVVFEITERQSVDDYATLTRTLNHYRKQGYRIAIDDAGAGYSSLQAIAELRPDYIKIDRSIIHDIDRDKVKEILLETLVVFAQKMNCQIIAEGIETYEELKKAIRLGVHFGQGYLLGRPNPELIPVPGEVVAIINRHQTDEPVETGSSLTIGNIARPAKVFDEKTVVAEVVDYFTQFESEYGVVIVRGNQPVGLVMREKLFQSLASQYGVPLYWKRSIRKLMDGYPLVLDKSVPVETASRLAMAREHNRVYDFVIVTQDGSLQGIVTVQSILDAITNAQIEYARDSNPLTGLPGNRRIDRELLRRISVNQPFSIIYADLDYFKLFNDLFGFQQGDAMIRFVAEILQQAVSSERRDGDFIGHIGGDDFIMITSRVDPQKLCEQILTEFEAGVKSFYTTRLFEEIASTAPAERWTDRWGQAVKSKEISISLALLECDVEGHANLTLQQIGKQAGELKKLAKSQTGSVYVKGHCKLLPE